MRANTRPDKLTREESESASARLERFTAMSSSSGDTAGLRRFATLLHDELTERGWKVAVEEHTLAETGAALPLVRARHGNDEFPLLLLGHFDTVLDAAPPARDSDRLRATGAIDMKGGIALLVAALDLQRTRGRPLPRALELVLVPDEEVGGAISRAATTEAGARARALWVLEPGARRTDGSETLVVGRRGLVNWQLAVRGVGAHSGLAFEKGRSAVAAACRWADAAARLSAPPTGPTVNLARIVGGEQDFVTDLGRQAALVGSGRQLNVVPDRAFVEGELRCLREAEIAATVDTLRELTAQVAAETGVELTFELGTAIPPVEPTAERVRYAEEACAVAARQGWRLEVELDRGGVSFPNFLPAGSDIPVLDGLGPTGDGMHTRDEWVDLRSFERRILLLAELLAVEAARDAPEAGSGSS